MTDVPFFERPAAQPVTLSQHFATSEYRIVSGSRVRYRKRTMKRFYPCEECAYLQHETGGKFGPKRAVKYRRVGPGDCLRQECKGQKYHESHIDLCYEHTQLWHERDISDFQR